MASADPWIPLPEQALYLDDRRPPMQATWNWVRNVAHAQAALADAPVANLSVDYELGPGQPDGGTLVAWLADTGRWPTEALQLHTGSSDGRKAMGQMIAH